MIAWRGEFKDDAKYDNYDAVFFPGDNSVKVMVDGQFVDPKVLREQNSKDLQSLIDLDRLEEIVRELNQVRDEIETAVSAGREVAAEIRRAARSANEAAGSISHEAFRLRR